MRRPIRINLCLAYAWAILAVGGPGCTSKRVDLIERGVVRLERVPTARGYYRDVCAYESENAIRVTGYVRRFLDPGHVHVQLVDSDGTVVVEERAPVNRPLRSSRVRHTRFEARLAVPPSTPTTIRVMHHRDPDRDQQG